MRSNKPYYLLLVTVILSLTSMALSQTAESPPIRAGTTQITNNYPDGIIFSIEVQSDSEIVRADFVFHRGSSQTDRVIPIEIEPSTELIVTHDYDTSDRTVIPGGRYRIHWEFEDVLGNQLSTPQEVFYYEDNRFAWSETGDEDVIVRWYEGDQEFGEMIYRVARAALTNMEKQTKRELSSEVEVLLYANMEDFRSWHAYLPEWSGGRSFPSRGVTAQVLPPGSPPEWIGQVIPHEIAHLFFYRIVASLWANWPPWIDEGFAQYYEFISHDADLDMAAEAASEGTLIPLMDLDVNFGIGRDSEEANLAYAESISAVTYLIETFSEDAIAKLVDAFREGITTRDAFYQALGVTWEEFEAGWITWMGVPVTPVPSPFPTEPLRPPTYPPPSYSTPTLLPPTEEQIAMVETDLPPTQNVQIDGGEDGDFAPDEPSPVCGSILSTILFPLVLFLWTKRRIW